MFVHTILTLLDPVLSLYPLMPTFPHAHSFLQIRIFIQDHEVMTLMCLVVHPTDKPQSSHAAQDAQGMTNTEGKAASKVAAAFGIAGRDLRMRGRRSSTMATSLSQQMDIGTLMNEVVQRSPSPGTFARTGSSPRKLVLGHVLERASSVGSVLGASSGEGGSTHGPLDKSAQLTRSKSSGALNPTMASLPSSPSSPSSPRTKNHTSSPHIKAGNHFQQVQDTIAHLKDTKMWIDAKTKVLAIAHDVVLRIDVHDEDLHGDNFLGRVDLTRLEMGHIMDKLIPGKFAATDGGESKEGGGHHAAAANGHPVATVTRSLVAVEGLAEEFVQGTLTLRFQTRHLGRGSIAMSSGGGSAEHHSHVRTAVHGPDGEGAGEDTEDESSSGSHNAMIICNVVGATNLAQSKGTFTEINPHCRLEWRGLMCLEARMPVRQLSSDDHDDPDDSTVHIRHSGVPATSTAAACVGSGSSIQVHVADSKALRSSAVGGGTRGGGHRAAPGGEAAADPLHIWEESEHDAQALYDAAAFRRRERLTGQEQIVVRLLNDGADMHDPDLLGHLAFDKEDRDEWYLEKRPEMLKIWLNSNITNKPDELIFRDKRTQEAVNTMWEDKEMPDKYRTLVCWLIFITVSHLVAFFQADLLSTGVNYAYQYELSVTKSFVETPFGADGTTTYEDIESTGDFWGWLEGPFLDNLYGDVRAFQGMPEVMSEETKQTNNSNTSGAAPPREALTRPWQYGLFPGAWSTRTEGGGEVTLETPPGVMRWSYLVGRARVRQLRMEEVPCKRVNAMFTASGYNDFVQRVEDKTPCFQENSEATETIVLKGPTGAGRKGRKGKKGKNARLNEPRRASDVGEEVGKGTAAAEDEISSDHLHGWNMTFVHSPSDVPHIMGSLRPTYSGGGYNYYLPLNGKSNKGKQTAKEELARLRASQWISLNTKAVVVEFVVFNIYHEMFEMVSMIVEFSQADAIHPSYELSTEAISQYAQPVDLVRGLLELIWILLLFLFWIPEEIDQMRSRWPTKRDFQVERKLLPQGTELSFFPPYFLYPTLRYGFFSNPAVNRGPDQTFSEPLTRPFMVGCIAAKPMVCELKEEEEEQAKRVPPPNGDEAEVATARSTGGSVGGSVGGSMGGSVRSVSNISRQKRNLQSRGPKRNLQSQYQPLSSDPSDSLDDDDAGSTGGAGGVGGNEGKQGNEGKGRNRKNSLELGNIRHLGRAGRDDSSAEAAKMKKKKSNRANHQSPRMDKNQRVEEAKATEALKTKFNEAHPYYMCTVFGSNLHLFLRKSSHTVRPYFVDLFNYIDMLLYGLALAVITLHCYSVLQQSLISWDVDLFPSDVIATSSTLGAFVNDVLWGTCSDWEMGVIRTSGTRWTRHSSPARCGTRLCVWLWLCGKQCVTCSSAWVVCVLCLLTLSHLSLLGRLFDSFKGHRNVVWACFCFVICVKTLEHLSIRRSYAIMVSIIHGMITRIMNFLVVYAVFLTAFTSVGYMLCGKVGSRKRQRDRETERQTNRDRQTERQ